MSTINLQTKLPKPIKTIWQAWTDPKQVPKWFSPEAHIEPQKGGAYELFWNQSNHDSMSTKGCKIIEYQPPTKLGFQWKGPDQYSHFMNTPPQTHIELTLEEKGKGTLVSIKHDGWKQSDEWIEAREWHLKAWTGVLRDLEQYLQR